MGARGDAARHPGGRVLTRWPASLLGPLTALCLLAGACGGGAPGPADGSATGGGSTGSCSGTPADTTDPAPTSTFDTVTPTAVPAVTVSTSAAPGNTPSTSGPTRTTAAGGSAAPATALYRGPTDREVVALTFDAGSDCGYAAQIVDTLADEGILATFGMTGRWAEANPDLVRRMVNEGHLLLNHTYDHRSFTGVSTGTTALTAAERRDELARADRAVAAITGSSMAPWFRPPYGDVDASVDADLGAAGYRYDVLWTVDSLGWKGLGPAEIAARCLDRAAPGAIYLFHVGSQSQDAAALSAIVAGLRGQGYGFVRVDDMVR